MKDEEERLLFAHSAVTYQSISSEGEGHVSLPSTVPADLQCHVGLRPTSGQPQIHTYKRRWYILFIFGLVTIMNGYVANIWSVIADSAEVAFKWTDHDIALILNWGSFTYLAGMVPFAWITTAKGFRVATLLSIGLVTLGCILRCISFQPPAVTWLAHISQIANGLGSPLSFSGAIVLSDRWFPPAERATATAIGTLVGYVGNSVCYIAAPLGVREVPPGTNNTKDISEIIAGIKTFRYTECGICILIFVLVIIYFPDRPPKPPSVSASKTEESGSFLQDLRQIFRMQENVSFWLISIAFAIFGGIGTAWASLIDVILKPIGVSQADSGWFGFAGGAAGCVAAVLTGRIADYFIGNMKPILLSLITVSTLGCYCSLLLAYPYIPYDRTSMYVVSVWCGMFQNAATPIFMEMTVEAAYPVSGVMSSGVATLLYQLPNIVTYLVLSAPSIGISWINWLQFAACWVAFPLVLIAREQYKRLEIDCQPSVHDIGNVEDDD